ncbi:guanylate kinase [Luteolibacter sp. AS25]|uniref:guanylate kinase n=1 Tax=Luteolibacter sp. AS25 TaxID=3135776 RepID=UPI00398A90A0
MNFEFPLPVIQCSLAPMSQRTGILIVVSGPSGSGKTTLCRRLANEGEAHYSISCTTRQPREGEVNGRDYHFLTREEFLEKREAGEFIESAEVHKNLYGTLRSTVVESLAKGSDVVMDLDVQGAAQVRACEDRAIRLSAIDLFVMPPNEQELHDRLAGRGTDSEEVIALRMVNALEEMRHWPEYTYRLISGDQEEDYTRFKSLIIAERLRVSRITVA